MVCEAVSVLYVAQPLVVQPTSAAIVVGRESDTANPGVALREWGCSHSMVCGYGHIIAEVVSRVGRIR